MTEQLHFLLFDCAKAFDCMDHKNDGKFFKSWEYQTTSPASWEICMQVRKQQLEPDMLTSDWFQIGKGVCQDCILSPCLFNLYAEYIMQNAGLEDPQAEIQFAGRNISNFVDMQMILL